MGRSGRYAGIRHVLAEACPKLARDGLTHELPAHATTHDGVRLEALDHAWNFAAEADDGGFEAFPGQSPGGRHPDVFAVINE